MDKKLQDLAWSILPKEFKEEVKKSYRYYSCMAKDQYDCGIMDTIETIFGKHNLTSDAEGEEMLYVPRKKVIQRYADTIKGLDGNISNSEEYFLNGKLTILKNLFGTKCLPDEEPKPAEPKFKVGDIVRFKYGCTPYRIDGFKMLDGTMLYQVGEVWAAASDLEPYTEPAEPTCTRTCTDDCPSQSRNLSQETANCDTHSNNSLTDKKNGGVDHFVVERDMVKGRRLNSATQITKALIQGVNFLYAWSNDEIKDVAHNSMRFADALIAEAEKGDKYGED